MKPIFFNKIFLIIALVFCTFSCTSDLDFDQVNDFAAHPSFTTNLAYLEVKAASLAPLGTGGGSTDYTADVEFLDNSFVRDDLVKAELDFRFKNSTPRKFIFNVAFLDINNAPIFRIEPISVEASVNGSDVSPPPTKIVFEENLDVIKNAKKMVFQIEVKPGVILSANDLKRIEISSSITAEFKVEVE